VAVEFSGGEEFASGPLVLLTAVMLAAGPNKITPRFRPTLRG